MSIMREVEKWGLIGVDEGERKEQGLSRKGIGKRVNRRRSTHGRRDSREGRERAVPRKSGRETNTAVVNRAGERRETKGGEDSELKRRVGESGAGKGERGTRRVGGAELGWKTLRVPNRYDYYLEGHRVNRVSAVRAASSLAGDGGNRRG